LFISGERRHQALSVLANGVEVFKERREGVERETTRNNDANMMAENVL